MHQDVHKANIVRKNNVSTAFSPRTSKIEEFFSVLSQPLISSWAIHPFQGTAIEYPSNAALT